MTRSMFRPRRAVALAVVAVSVAASLSACGGTLSDAATVTLSRGSGGEKTVVHVRRDDLDADLRVMRANKDFVKFVRDNGIEVPKSSSSIGSALSAIWLTDLVNQAIIDTELKTRHLAVVKKDRDTVKDQIQESYGGAAVFKKFPQAFRDTIIERAASWNALLTRGAEKAKAPTDAEARKFYEKNAAQIGACASGLAVAHILVATEAKALDVKSQLDSGADFAKLAKDLSTDSSTAAGGGKLGCLQDGSFVKEFEDAAKAAKIGEPTAPVKTQYGYHVILVSTYVAPTYEEMKDQIVQYLQSQADQASSQKMNDVVKKRLASVEVDIDPRYGKWVKKGQQGPHVEPPDAGSPTEGRNGSASTTTTSTTAPAGTAPVQGG